jgi:hypothetical protein
MATPALDVKPLYHYNSHMANSSTLLALLLPLLLVQDGTTLHCSQQLWLLLHANCRCRQHL